MVALRREIEWEDFGANLGGMYAQTSDCVCVCVEEEDCKQERPADLCLPHLSRPVVACPPAHCHFCSLLHRYSLFAAASYSANDVQRANINNDEYAIFHGINKPLPV